jgi:hypothetical protein
MPQFVASAAALCDAYPQLRVAINFFDAEHVHAGNILRQYAGNNSRLEGNSIPGMKTLFWKIYLTPSRTKHLEAVWIFDCDIAVHPSVFPLGQLVGALTATRATVLQHSMQALVHGTYHTWLRVRKAHMSCMATTAQWVEMQTPIFSGDAWARFHTRVLSIVPDEGLASSDFGVDITWCALLQDEFPNRPTCLVTPAIAATHLNSHAIEKFMTKDVSKKVRSCTTTCLVLQKHFNKYWKNTSHHTGECFAISEHRGLMHSRSYFSIDGDGTVRARHWRDQKRASQDVEPPEGESDAAKLRILGNIPRVLGATTIHSKDRKLGILVFALTRLCNAVPNFRAVVNVQDGAQAVERTGRKQDVSQDSRISTTWISGTPSLFWKRVLTAKYVGDADFVWLFDS